MKTLVIAVTLALAAGLSLAQEAKEPTRQQARMAECNKKAADMKGEERKAFMKDCLTDKRKAQQDKMKACNAEAGALKGDERKAFMSQCLKKD
ncbi:MAG: PsiF family protein [Caldimonas sp.]|uniref:PsiF family protein n=1 Tax=Caldimonas sp. TaxID=2838790 RepID=UPI00391AC20B